MNDEDLVVRIEREFHATPKRLFEAWSNPEFLKRWWGSLSVATLDFREGGSYRFEWENWDGYVEGNYLVIRPDLEISFTWCSHPKSEGEDVSEVRITFEAVTDGVTRLTLVHSLNRTQDVFQSHQRGWISALDSLTQEPL